MMNVKHAKKQITLTIPDFGYDLKLKINLYSKSYQGNHAGFSVKIDDGNNKVDYHVNVLSLDEALVRGVTRFMKAFHGTSDLTTVYPFPACNWVHDYKVVIIDGKTGHFRIDGNEFWLEWQKQSNSDEEIGLQMAHIRGKDWDADYSLGTVLKWEKDDTYTVLHNDTSREHTDPVIAAAQMIALTV